MFADVKRFFDCKLKDDCVAMPLDEPPVHFFLSGADQWQSSSDWPPSGVSLHSLHLSTGLELTATATHGAVDWTIDRTASSGVVSRWNLVQHLMKKAVTYPDRDAQSNKCLVFTGKALQDDLSIVGSAHLELSLQLLQLPDAAQQLATDAVVFAYLEEFDPITSSVRYITEGNIRASHPVTSTGDTRPGAFDPVRRSFYTTDMRPLSSSAPTTVHVILVPVAYKIRAGNRLRLSLAGADVDNFYLENIPNLASAWRVHMDQSIIRLPVQSMPSVPSDAPKDSVVPKVEL